MSTLVFQMKAVNLVEPEICCGVYSANLTNVRYRNSKALVLTGCQRLMQKEKTCESFITRRTICSPGRVWKKIETSCCSRHFGKRRESMRSSAQALKTR